MTSQGPEQNLTQFLQQTPLHSTNLQNQGKNEPKATRTAHKSKEVTVSKRRVTPRPGAGDTVQRANRGEQLAALAMISTLKL